MSPIETAATMTDSASVDFEIPAPGTPGHVEWRKTGKLPDGTEPAFEKHEETEVPEAKEVEAEPPAADEDETAEIAAAPAAAPPQGRKKDAAARLREVLAERKKDRELIEQLTRKLAGPQSVEPTSHPAAAPAKVEAKSDTKPKRPKLADLDAKGTPVFKTYGEFEAAVEKYESDIDDWNRTELLRLFDDKQTKAQKSKEVADAEKVIAQHFGTRCTEARKKYADFDAVALNPNLPITNGSVPDAFILDSEVGTDVAYYLGSHTDELEHILTLNPLAQGRALFKIEQQFVAPQAPAHKKEIPARPVTKAPTPPHQVTGKGPVADPVEKAVEEGDQRAYTEAENAKALLQWKSRRR